MYLLRSLSLVSFSLASFAPRLPAILVAIALLLLTACSQQLAKPDQQQSQKPIPEQWSISAKLGIRTADDSGSLTVKWQQDSREYLIQVSGPLGQGNGKISGNDQYITIERPNQPTIYSADPQQLLKDTFQWELPIQHLSYWVRGLPSPRLDDAQYHYSNTGVLERLTQSGWELAYDRYRLADDWLMPGRVKATHDELRLTLIIRQWQFGINKP